MRPIHLSPLVALLAALASAQSVELQPSTPGIPQPGHLHIVGTAMAGSFVGSGTGLVNVPWGSLSGLPAGFADHKDDGLVLGTAYTENNALDLIDVTQLGAGRAAEFAITGTQNSKEALFARSAGTGRGLRVLCDGTNPVGAASIEWKPKGINGGLGSALRVESTGPQAVEVLAHGAHGLHVQHEPWSAAIGTGLSVISHGGGDAFVAIDRGGGWALQTLSHVGPPHSNGGFFSSPVGTIALGAGGGTKNAVVPTSQGARLMYSEEATEVWFTDYGFGGLSNGLARIELDDLFAETVDLTQPYHVFVQVDDARCNGVAVERKTAAGFDVVELGHGASNAGFSYRVVAKRKGYAGDRLKRLPEAESDRNVYPHGFVEGVVPAVE